MIVAHSRRRLLLGAMCGVVGCVRSSVPEPLRPEGPVPGAPIGAVPPIEHPPTPSGLSRVARVVVASGASVMELHGDEGLEVRIVGATAPLRVAAGQMVQLRARAGRLSVVGADRAWEGSAGEGVEVLTAGTALLRVGTRRYRGWVRVIPTDSGVLGVNFLPVEQYLRGVVPLEIGPRRPAEQAAVEAQAIAARSYTVVRMAASGTRAWDLRGSTADQVYGGADAERPESDAAVSATTGVVLTYAGRVVEAPYSAACGGETAAAEEVFRSAGAPHLQRVSDRRAGGGAWCDIAPGFTWERSIDGEALQRGVDRYLRTYVRGVTAPLPPITDVRRVGVTPSGRAAGVAVHLRDGSRPTVERNELRYVLRPPDGAILPSTYLSLAPERRRDGSLARLVITGRGNGHGVGMCQWGAIGRARAGADARSILRTYYPGTSLQRVD
jgi:stage II sporulation protein D